MNGRGPGVTGRTLIHVTQSIKCVMYYNTGITMYDNGFILMILVSQSAPIGVL